METCFLGHCKDFEFPSDWNAIYWKVLSREVAQSEIMFNKVSLILVMRKGEGDQWQ